MSQVRTVKTVFQRRTNPQRNNRTNIKRRIVRSTVTNRNIGNRSNINNGLIRPIRKTRLSNRPNPYLYPTMNVRRVNRAFKPTVYRKRNQPTMNNIVSGPNKDYIMCRIAPFIANGMNSSIPDGSMQRKVMIDHRMQIPFVLGSTGSMNVAITPNIPCPVWFQTPNVDTAYIVNNLTFPHWTSSSYNTIMFSEWFGRGVRLNDAAGSYDEVQTLMDSARARIITAAWSITYTGTFNNNSGSLRVNSFQASALEPVPNSDTFSVFNNQTGGSKVWNHSQIFTRVMNQNLPFLGNNSQETRTFALREGAHGLLRHNATEYEWCDLQSTMSYLTQPANDKHSLLNLSNIGSEATAAHWPLSLAYDDDWSCALLNINGATPGSSFLLDVVYCIEYTPNQTDVAFALAKPAPPRNDNAIQSADRIANAQPIAKSGNASSSNFSDYLKTGVSVVSSVAPLVLA